MSKKSNEITVPIEVNDKILKAIDTEQDNIEHSWDISYLIRKMIFPRKANNHAEPGITAIKNKITKQLSQRNGSQVYALWQELNIDRTTISFFMDTFGIKDSEGIVYNQIIPSDSAEVFVWFRYGSYPWEDLGKEFGIFTYVWLYGFFFPERIFEIPQPEFITEAQHEYFRLNYDFFRCKVTMEHVIKLILLYQDDKRADSILFEPDLPWKNSKIKCNLIWKNKFQASALN